MDKEAVQQQLLQHGLIRLAEQLNDSNKSRSETEAAIVQLNLWADLLHIPLRFELVQGYVVWE